MKKIQIIFILSFVVLISACDNLPLPFLGGGDSGPTLPNTTVQWGWEASASSAYGGILGKNRDDQSPYAATGEPDVEGCQESKKAWTIRQEDDGLHWLEIRYWDRVYVSNIKIYENFNPGFIKKIELKNGSDENDYFTLWEGSYDPRRTCPYIFETSFEYMDDNNITRKMTPFATDTVKITVDTNVPGWNEIDAVQLTGYMDNWYWYNNSVHYD